MANSPSIFAFDSAALRVLRDEAGAPWFNANDVCAALALTNPHKAVADHVDPDDLTKREVIDAMGRPQAANFINESGMYALIFGSTKPEAKKFKRWVTSEVLPAIRQTGRYEANKRGPAIPLDLIIDATNAYAHTVKTLAKTMGTRQAHVLANNQAKAMGLDLHRIWKLDPATLPDSSTSKSNLAKLTRYIRQAGGTAKHQELLKRMHCTAAEFKELIDQAVVAGHINPVTIPGYAGQAYKLVGAAA